MFILAKKRTINLFSFNAHFGDKLFDRLIYCLYLLNMNNYGYIVTLQPK